MGARRSPVRSDRAELVARRSATRDTRPNVEAPGPSVPRAVHRDGTTPRGSTRVSAAARGTVHRPHLDDVLSLVAAAGRPSTPGGAVAPARPRRSPRTSAPQSRLMETGWGRAEARVLGPRPLSIVQRSAQALSHPAGCAWSIRGLPPIGTLVNTTPSWTVPPVSLRPTCTLEGSSTNASPAS